MAVLRTGALEEAQFLEELQCAVCEWVVNLQRHTLWVFTPPHNVPDMGGAIAFATRMDPFVWDILFFEDGDGLRGVPHTHYTHDGQDWRAVYHRTGEGWFSPARH